MALNNEGNLVVLSPFNEPSGLPLWKNYATAYWNGRGSGISFDWHAHITNGDTDEPQSCWPGADAIFIQESGTTHRGYRAQGTSDIQTAANNTAAKKALVLGAGAFQHRSAPQIPNVAQSGFTIGFWVSPQSDGYIRHQGGTLETLARRNAIISKGATTDALFIGVSGAMRQGAQFSQDVTGSGLQAFAVAIANSLPGVQVNTPIESGAYTHVTFTYRFTAANSAAAVIYKNGRVAASGTSSAAAANQLCAANAQWNDRPLTIGGQLIGNAVGTDRYEDAGGFGHLISGVYVYDRVLNEGEILNIHNQGGLQVDSTLTYPTYKVVSITDPDIVSYIPFVSPGFIDVSRHHLNMFANQDEYVTGGYLACPGPFGRTMPFNDTTNAVDLAIGTPSGTMIELLYGGNGSFTIAGWFAIDGAAGVTSALFDNSTLFSFGSLGTNFEFNPARQTGGFQVSSSGIANNTRISARLYDGGVVTIPNTKVLTNPEIDMFLSMCRHIALVYDEQTFGVALYVDGMLSQSGTMPASMLPQMQRLAGSGYPLVFLGGVPSETVDTYSNLAGDDCGVCDIFIAKRPLLPSEIRYIAESGIDITPLYYSVHDPRLKAYWDCTGSGTNDMIVQDTCMNFGSGGIPAHLVQCIGDPIWTLIAANSGPTKISRIDRFSLSRHPDRGITSGSWTAMSNTDGVPHTASATGEWSRTSSTDFAQRFRMMADERDVRAPALNNEWIIGFNVTPSGTLPLNSFGQVGREVNSMLLFWGETGSSNDAVYSYLTSHTDPASGVIIVFQSSDGTTLLTPLVSGSIAYAAQSRIMFHAKPLLPYNNDTLTPIEMTLYVNGNPVHRSVLANQATAGPAARLYDSDAAQGSSDNWNLQIGGRAMQDIFSSQATGQDGLGQIYMNGIFIMTGSFSRNDLLRLAASGINSSKTISNYSNTLPTSAVTIEDPNLEGYWRFSGPDSASGTLDLSSKANDLNPIAKSVNAATAFFLRFLPLGFVNAPLPRQASGITYNGAAPTATSPPPFAISGSLFQIPQSGFSVGFWIAPREAVAANDAIAVLSYGVVPSVVTSAVFTDSSWAVLMDDDSNFALVLSQDGKMKLSNVATPSASQTKCAIYRTLVSDLGSDIEVFRRGYFNPGHMDSMEHIAFTYKHVDGVSGVIKGYFNGEKVAEMTVPSSGFHQPMVPESRFISFMIPQTGTWAFGTTRGTLNSVLSDVFYFSRPIGDEEVRYIALNGIGPPSVDVASGVIGGYIQSLAGSEGTIGGYVVGLDTTSGVIGGYAQGAFASSGTIGGIMLGMNLGSGKIGGYIKGTIESSGVIGGYISSREIASGCIGAWTRGAIRNVHYFDAAFAVEFFANADFDAKFRVNQTNSADFDAQLIVFQAEQPPDVSIIVPNATLIGTSIPWNQYFVGSGRAVQGKSIVQAKFSFSDFTAPVTVTESGNNLYPVSHVFGQSGFYIVRFSVIDSNGQHASATRIIDLSAGVPPVNIALSGVPTEGFAPLSVQFSQTTISVPNNVAIIAQILTFDDGQESIITNPLHIYTEPGIYRPIWVVRDSRGVIWSDSLVAGVNN